METVPDESHSASVGLIKPLILSSVKLSDSIMSKFFALFGLLALCVALAHGRPETRGIMDSTCSNGFRDAASAPVGRVGFMPAGCFTGAYTKCQQAWSSYFAAVPKNPPPPANAMPVDCVTSAFSLG